MMKKAYIAPQTRVRLLEQEALCSVSDGTVEVDNTPEDDIVGETHGEQFWDFEW